MKLRVLCCAMALAGAAVTIPPALAQEKPSKQAPKVGDKRDPNDSPIVITDTSGFPGARAKNANSAIQMCHPGIGQHLGEVAEADRSPVSIELRGGGNVDVRGMNWKAAFQAGATTFLTVAWNGTKLTFTPKPTRIDNDRASVSGAFDHVVVTNDSGPHTLTGSVQSEVAIHYCNGSGCAPSFPKCQ